ncbi:hypothetical protein FRC09_018263, partial [Ceratobasidium sp. 395]
FWEGRQITPINDNATSIDKTSDPNPSSDTSLRAITPLPTVPGTFWTSRSSALGAATGGHGDDSHPLDYARVLKLKRELVRWEREKAYAMGKMKIDSWARGACEASVKGVKWKWNKDKVGETDKGGSHGA